MDYILIGLKNTFCFLGDILIVSKGSKEDHKRYVLSCLKRLDEQNLRINLQQCHFAYLKIDWLGYRVSQPGISPIESKSSAILTLETPKTLKKLRSILGSVKYICEFIPNLAQISHPLRPFVEKIMQICLNRSTKKCFIEIKSRIANATKNCQNNPQLRTCVKSDDATRSGFGAALEQLSVDEWKPIVFTSRFLNSCEGRYSVSEWELLGVVWSIEYFKNYSGKQFKVITYHRALLSILTENCSKKWNKSRLIR